MEITEEPDELEVDRGKILEEGRNADPNRASASNPRCETGNSGRFGFDALKLSPRSSPSETSLGGKSEGRNVDPDCVNASNPFHQCGEYCTKKKPSEKGKSGRFALSLLKMSPRSPSERSIGGKSVQTRERVKVAGRNVDPSCPNASNPFHKCAEYCNEKTADARKQSKTRKRVQNGEGSMRGMQMDSISVSSSNSFHQRTPEASMPTNGNTLVQSRERVKVAGRNVDPSCPNASNPFHKCAEYCNEKTADARKQSKTGKQVQNGEGSMRGMQMDSISVSSSNSFHQRTPEASRPTNGNTLESKEEGPLIRANRNEEAVIRENRKVVDSRCPNALNPFHECVEYCHKRVGESGRSEKSKPDRSKGSSKFVMGTRDVDPRCVNASNPFHKCAEYCFEKIREAK